MILGFARRARDRLEKHPGARREATLATARSDAAELGIKIDFWV